MLTLGQAAREVGKTKTALANAIKSGRLTATRDDKGQYQIDPAELFRVYPVTGQEVGDTRPSTLQRENELLREQLDREREINRRLFDRLDEESAERRRLTALLTHHPPASNMNETRPARFSFWQRLTGKG